MELKRQTIKELKEIMAKDYEVTLSEEKLADFGVSLLRLTRLAVTALVREREGIYVRTQKAKTKK